MIKNLKIENKKYENIKLHKETNDIEEFISLEKELESIKNKIKIATDDVQTFTEKRKDAYFNSESNIFASGSNIFALGMLITLFAVSFFEVSYSIHIPEKLIFIISMAGGLVIGVVTVKAIGKIDSKKLAKKKAIVESLESTKSIIEEKIESLKNTKGPQFIHAVEDKKEEDAVKAIMLEKISTRERLDNELAALSNSMQVQRYIELTTQRQQLDEELKTYSSETELDKPKEKTLGTI